MGRVVFELVAEEKAERAGGQEAAGEPGGGGQGVAAGAAQGSRPERGLDCRRCGESAVAWVAAQRCDQAGPGQAQPYPPQQGCGNCGGDGCDGGGPGRRYGPGQGDWQAWRRGRRTGDRTCRGGRCRVGCCRGWRRWGGCAHGRRRSARAGQRHGVDARPRVRRCRRDGRSDVDGRGGESGAAEPCGEAGAQPHGQDRAECRGRESERKAAALSAGRQVAASQLADVWCMPHAASTIPPVGRARDRDLAGVWWTPYGATAVVVSRSCGIGCARWWCRSVVIRPMGVSPRCGSRRRCGRRRP
jgi:hypothetical protein